MVLSPSPVFLLLFPFFLHFHHSSVLHYPYASYFGSITNTAMIHIQDTSREELQDVANALGLAQRIVVITGAEVSTDVGIPVRYSPSLLKSLD